MDFQEILYEVRDGVARVTLNRPKVLNAITPLMLDELNQAVAQAGADDAVRVVVLTGAGRAFSAGVDLAALGQRELKGGEVGAILNDPARSFIKAVEELPKVVIGAINGFCITGALELALSCDLLIASEVAKFGDTHAKWGLRCTWGMSVRLPARVGWARAREMTYTARLVTAEEALGMGLVNKVVPADQLSAEADAWAQGVMANSPAALAAHKQLYRQGFRDATRAALEREFNTAFDIPDTMERLGEFMKK